MSDEPDLIKYLHKFLVSTHTISLIKRFYHPPLALVTQRQFISKNLIFLFSPFAITFYGKWGTKKHNSNIFLIRSHGLQLLGSKVIKLT
jgi:hypothetical protein